MTRLVHLISAMLAIAAASTPSWAAGTEPAPAEPAAESAPKTADTSDSVPPYDWSLRAKDAYLATYKEACASFEPDDKIEDRKPDIYDLKFRYASDEADMPDRVVTLYRFFCNRGAYNETHVFFMRTDAPDIVPVAFAEPALHTRYENEDSEGKLLGVDIIGWRASSMLVNSEVDPAKNTVTSFSKWRGVGDASSSGVWILKEGAFVLSTYDVDASYDGEINPQTISDFRAANETLNETP